MRIKLIYPSLRKANPNLKWWKQPRAHRYPGLGLTTVAALCPPKTEVEIIDDEFEDIDYNEQTDLTGISLLTINAYRGYQIADIFREKNIPVVLGGMHVSACPEEAAAHADSIVIGEAEDTWPELLKDFGRGKLKPIYSSTNNADLANIPIPRRDLLNPKNYLTLNTVQATRGCPHRCEFCSIVSLSGSKTRFRPVEEVFEEIKTLGGNIFVLNDDNLAQTSDYFKELFEKIIPLKKKWAGEASWNIIKDDQSLDLLEKSGCRGLAIGFESLEPKDGVKKICRSVDNSLLYKEVVKKLHDRGICVIANFIFGFDDENESIFERTLTFALESKVDLAHLTILTPYPGTPLFKRLEKEERIIDRNWNNYNSYTLCFKLKTMTRESFLEKFNWVKSQFYTYPRIVSRIARETRRASPFSLSVLLGINLGFRKSIKKSPCNSKLHSF